MLDFNFFFFSVDTTSLYGLIFSIITYLLLLSIIFLLIFFTNNSNASILVFFNSFQKINFFFISSLIALLSLAGIPPLLGFLSKLVLFLLLFKKQFILFIIYFFIMNIFMLYFYIQNTRFLVKKISISTFFSIYLNSYFFKGMNYLILFNFFNLCTFLLIDSVFIVLGSIYLV